MAGETHDLSPERMKIGKCAFTLLKVIFSLVMVICLLIVGLVPLSVLLRSLNYHRLPCMYDGIDNDGGCWAQHIDTEDMYSWHDVLHIFSFGMLLVLSALALVSVCLKKLSSVYCLMFLSVLMILVNITTSAIIKQETSEDSRHYKLIPQRMMDQYFYQMEDIMDPDQYDSHAYHSARLTFQHKHSCCGWNAPEKFESEETAEHAVTVSQDMNLENVDGSTPYINIENKESTIEISELNTALPTEQTTDEQHGNTDAEGDDSGSAMDGNGEYWYPEGDDDWLSSTGESDDGNLPGVYSKTEYGYDEEQHDYFYPYDSETRPYYERILQPNQYGQYNELQKRMEGHWCPQFSYTYDSERHLCREEARAAYGDYFYYILDVRSTIILISSCVQIALMILALRCTLMKSTGKQLSDAATTAALKTSEKPPLEDDDPWAPDTKPIVV